MKIEYNPAFAEKLPRICYVLGGENNPIKINEEFKAKGHIGKYRIHGGIIEWCEDNIWASVSSWDVCEFINQPEVIIRRPQFSEDEKALMRLYVKAGRPLFLPACGGEIVAWSRDGIYGSGLPKGILPQIIDRFDAEDYLESEESK